MIPPTELWQYVAALLATITTLSMCALFAFLETTVTALRAFSIIDLEQKVTGCARLIFDLKHERHRVLTAMLIANTCATIMATMATTHLAALLSKGLAYPFPLICSILSTAGLTLICGEVIPKHLGKLWGVELIAPMLWIVEKMYLAMYPLVRLFTSCSEKVVNHLVHHLGLTPKNALHISSSEVEFILHHVYNQGILSQAQYAFIKQALDLSRMPVTALMEPLGSDKSIMITTKVSEIATTSPPKRSYYRYLPVYNGTQKEVVGIIPVSKLTVERSAECVTQCMVPAATFLNTMPVSKALQLLAERKIPCAVICNDKGLPEGIISTACVQQFLMKPLPLQE